MISVGILEPPTSPLYDHGNRFSLLGEPNLDLPLTTSVGNLNLGIVEVGCRRKTKIAQLIGKRRLIADHTDGKGTPLTHRICVHYRGPTRFSDADSNFPEVVVTYKATPEAVLETIARIPEYQLAECFRKESSAPQKLDYILAANKPHEVIDDFVRHNETSPILRGLLAECAMRTDFMAALPKGMEFTPSLIWNISNSRYREGTEVDGMLRWYKPGVFDSFLEQLNSYDHLNVRRKLE